YTNRAKPVSTPSSFVTALSRQISIGDFRRRISPSALKIHEQKQWAPPRPGAPDRSIEFSLTMPSAGLQDLRAWSILVGAHVANTLCAEFRHNLPNQILDSCAPFRCFGEFGKQPQHSAMNGGENCSLVHH